MGRIAARSCCMEETGMNACESISGSIMLCRRRVYMSSVSPFVPNDSTFHKMLSANDHVHCAHAF